MLSNAAVKAASPRARPYKLFDGGGLHLFVSPTGAKSWRLKCRRDGREQLLTLGRWPEVSLAEARSRSDEARAAVKHPDQFNALRSFEQLARAWHAHNLPRWSPAHAAQVLADFERDVFPAIGTLAPDAIGAPDLLAVLRLLEARGALATARRLRQRLSAVFGFGVSTGAASRDPAALLGRALSAPALVRPHAALTSIQDCRALLAACEDLGAARAVVLAHRLLALTAVRLDAVRGCRWDEFELDGPEPVWRVPPARMKLARAKKDEERFAHLVPLSPQALTVLREARALVPGDGLVFSRTGRAPIGEGAIRTLIARAGFAGRHVPHGWRSSFSTVLNEALGEGWAGAIDRALAHSPKDKVEAAYNRAQQLDRRRELFDRWGTMLAGDG